MSLTRSKLSRRSFLAAAGGSAVISPSSAVHWLQSAGLTESKLRELRTNLLLLINEERSLARVSALAFDDLAAKVATDHASDMARAKFASHWGSDGRKPYQRYSFAGGIHAVEENVSAADNTWSLKPADLAQDLAYLHVRLYEETPPNDGHRRTILAPQHTHVGLGIAVEELRLRLVELFVAKHLKVNPIGRKAKADAIIPLAGTVLTPEVSLLQIEVFYEPLPRPRERSWLQQRRPYSLPDESVTLWPKLSGSLLYSDGTRGVIETDGRNFRTDVVLFKKMPGIYTIACWVRKGLIEKPFIATLICIEAGD